MKPITLLPFLLTQAESLGLVPKTPTVKLKINPDSVSIQVSRDLADIRNREKNPSRKKRLRSKEVKK
jgi:hypothetical protein